jgi:hypothetical protein
VSPAGRRVICTIAHGPHRALFDVTGPPLERYAARHGYELVVMHDRLAPSRPVAWDKVPLLHTLCTDYDLVCWVDADALVVDDAVDIADDFAPNRFMALVEHRIRGERIPNSGVMVFRGGRVAARFLDRVWRQSAFAQHRWWENAAILHLLGYRVTQPIRPARPSVWRLGVGKLDHRWNSIPADPAAEPVIVHFPGVPVEERLHALRRVTSRA